MLGSGDELLEVRGLVGWKTSSKQAIRANKNASPGDLEKGKTMERGGGNQQRRRCQELKRKSVSRMAGFAKKCMWAEDYLQ